ncbi:MAG: proline--tRNA ligase [Pseudomonadota bacterium]|nr:proline--tRNA ligase [Pseudomonadota bacterium]
MRLSNLPLNTFKEKPAEAEISSHQLMLRAGLIRPLASGLFTWMPMGLKVLRKVEKIVRMAMNEAGAFEILMPAIQPAELWQESERWGLYGPLLLKMRDRNDREFCFGPTHEEVMTDIARRELKSYKQLPVTYYQIQTKFRDEIRPRFGVMRAREFLMKDAYSFHLDQESLQETYDLMAHTYQKIFDSLGLQSKSVDADSGEIGGNKSREFHILANSGEDKIAYTDEDDFAINVELAPVSPQKQKESKEIHNLEKISTPEIKSIEEICEKLKISPKDTLKTLVVEGEDESLIALVLRGDHVLNRHKAEKINGISKPLSLASEEKIENAFELKPGSLGPLGLNARIIADHSAICCKNFVCGANETGFHYKGVNWEIDLPKPEAADLRDINEDDKSPDGNKIKIARGIEVGHIFQLGEKYSTAMNANVLNQAGKEQNLLMGCYGIGISRIVAAAIEQNYDEKGICWPNAIAPFELVLISINAKKSKEVISVTNKLYSDLTNSGIEVLYDDREVRPGVKFADAELLGVPHQVLIGDRTLSKGIAEYRKRGEKDFQEYKLGDIRSHISQILEMNRNVSPR